MTGNNNFSSILLGLVIGMFIIPSLIKSCAKVRFEYSLKKAGYYVYEEQQNSYHKQIDSLEVIDNKRHDVFDHLYNSHKALDENGNYTPELEQVNKRGRELNKKRDSLYALSDIVYKKKREILESL